MRAAVRIWNRIGKGKNLIVVTVVILQHDIDKDLIALSRNHHRLGMNDLFVLAELLYEFLDAMLVNEEFFFGRITALIGQCDFKTGIQERKLAQPRREPLEFVLRRDREDRRIGKKCDERAGRFFVLEFADDIQFLRGFSALESHVINLALARNFNLEPIGKSVDAFRADAVQTTGIFVSALAEFSAGVKICQDQLDCRHLPFRMHVDRNAAAIVTHGNGAIDMNRDFNLCAKTGEMFVDRVIENLEDHVMQTALIGVADVHARALADGFEPLKFIDLRRVVFLRFSNPDVVVSGILVVRFVVFRLEAKQRLA